MVILSAVLPRMGVPPEWAMNARLEKEKKKKMLVPQKEGEAGEGGVGGQGLGCGVG